MMPWDTASNKKISFHCTEFKGCKRASADNPKTNASPATKIAACITFRHVSCALQRDG